MSTNLLSEIEQFQAETGLGDHRLGFLAVKNGRLVERLRSGGRIWPDTAEKVLSFIAAERIKRAECVSASHD